MNKAKQYMYYIIIGVVSFVALVFLPFIGSDIGLGWDVPNTAVGWIVWCVTRLIVSGINVLIFHSFIQQGKLNVKDNEKYKEAQDILCKVREKEYIPRSPKKWQSQTYGKKGVTIMLGSVMATVALTQALLSYDWVTFLSYLFTIVMGLIFGILQMKNSEEYWSEEFWKYAHLVQEENEKQEKLEQELAKVPCASERELKKAIKNLKENIKDVDIRQQTIQEPTGTSIAESDGHSVSDERSGNA